MQSVGRRRSQRRSDLDNMLDDQSTADQWVAPTFSEDHIGPRWNRRRSWMRRHHKSEEDEKTMKRMLSRIEGLDDVDEYIDDDDNEHDVEERDDNEDLDVDCVKRVNDTVSEIMKIKTAPNLKAHIPSYGRLRGLITRNEILTMIDKRMFCNAREMEAPVVRESYEKLRDTYPRYPSTESIRISTEEQDKFKVDFSLAMDLAPICVNSSMTYTTVFDILRTLGLRHIVVINTKNEVVGMITRKDLIVIETEHHLFQDPVLKFKPTYFAAKLRVPGFNNIFCESLGIRGGRGLGPHYDQLQEETETVTDE